MGYFHIFKQGKRGCSICGGNDSLDTLTKSCKLMENLRDKFDFTNWREINGTN